MTIKCFNNLLILNATRMHASKPAYLFANWKMYLDYQESVALIADLKKHAKDFDHVTMAVFPNALAVSTATDELKKTSIAVGAQNIYWLGKGGCTGETSAEMYKALGSTYALVGHSERRHLFKESNHDVRQKIEAALAAGLTPVVCVGETAKERDAGETKEVLETQLRSAFSDISWPSKVDVIVAYEPVWAIDHGEKSDPCNPAKAEEICALLRGYIRNLISGADPVLLYGGSVRPNNVTDYVKQNNIDGVLVGAASTKTDSWLSIAQAILL